MVEYAAPTGLWSLWNLVLQICRAYGAEEKCATARIVSRWTESRNKVQKHFMNTIKQRRYLITLCIANFIAWIGTSFALMIGWYVKGDSVNSDAFMVWHMFVFDIIPGYSSGYLIFGLLLLNFITKTKTPNA